MNMSSIKCFLGIIVWVAGATTMADVAQAAVTQNLEPTTIDVGQAARLTIAATGVDAESITPPMVAGLEFIAVGQSQQVESLNGVTHSTTSVTYQVVPRQPGVFTIPGTAPGSQPLVLTVAPGSAAGPSTFSRSSAPAGAGGGTAVSAKPQSAAGSAFVRLRIPKHELYVGETIPVDIQVGTRDGVVASLNGPPTLNGDAFTLDKLSSQPERTAEVIGGRPYTIFTWRSALAAVKPGSLSLTMDMPLTVRVRTAADPDGDPLGALGLNDLFNDPALQNFFGASTEREVTVASSPMTFNVLALPTQNRPADFSGAVGHFTVTSNLSDDKAPAGDPVTLRLRISGEGNFDRVNTHMLQQVGAWKTYAPTSHFDARDDIGFHGVKTFEQPLIAMQPGDHSLPPLTFSWFDPDTRRYVQTSTPPLTVEISPSPAATDGAAHSRLTTAANPALPPVGNRTDAGLRPDQIIRGTGATSLTPHYYEPVYMGVPSALVLAFSGAWFWVRRREHGTGDADRQEASLDPAPMMRVMDDAIRAGDAELFFKSARAALQKALASTWQLPPDEITRRELDSHLGEKSEVARLFALADETAYAGARISTEDLQQWRALVIRHMNQESAT